MSRTNTAMTEMTEMFENLLDGPVAKAIIEMQSAAQAKGMVLVHSDGNSLDGVDQVYVASGRIIIASVDATAKRSARELATYNGKTAAQLLNEVK